MKKYMNVEDITNTNCSTVLDIIQKNGQLSRKQITDMTGLSWGGMTKIVNRLLENGYIVEEKQTTIAKSGRKPSVVSVNTKTNFVIGLDINKTGLKAIVTNLSGEIMKEYQAPVCADRKDSMLNEIVAFVSTIFSDFKSGEIIAMGVAVQGIVDSKNGISVMFPDVKDWSSVPLGDILKQQFQVEVFIEHDPDCLLYPFLENREGNLLLFRIDKSIGMAVSVRNKILKDTGILEIAHNIIVPDGKPCSCGNRGCAEAYISPCLENNLPNQNSIDELIPVLSIIIKNMVSIFHAGAVVLTGELMQYHELFETNLSEQLSRLNCKIDIVYSDSENYAVRGAALLAIRKSINSLVI